MAVGDISELSEFMNNDQGGGTTAQAAPAPYAAPPGDSINDLSKFMNEKEAPDNGIIDRLEEGAKTFARGAVQNAKVVSNLAAKAAIGPDPLGLAKDVKPPFELPPEAGTAEAEALASGATLGYSRIVERAILHNQEDQARRAKDNQDLVSFGNTIGQGGLIMATGGASGAVEAMGVKGLAKTALTGALDASGLAAGDVVSDQALGNPHLTAQKLSTALWDARGDIGTSAIFGGIIGPLAHGLASRFTPDGVFKGTVAENIVKNQSDAPPVRINPESAPIEIDPNSPFHTEYQEGIKKTNLAQMEAALSKARAMGLTTELPQKSAVIDAESRLHDLQLPLNQVQVDSLDSQGARDQLGVLKQIRIEGGGTLADFETAQKAERLLATDKAIRDMAPGADVTSDLHEAGQRAIKTFTDNYQANQEALRPFFENLKQLETADPFGHQNGVIKAMTARVPGVSRMFDMTGPEVKIAPYSTSWGIDKATYEAVAQAHKALEEPAFIQELLNVRNGLDQNINVQQPGRAATQIRQLKAGMMDYIQQQIQQVEPKIPASDDMARHVLRDWAVNEQHREIIEKAFGATVGTPEFNQLSRVNPEKILGKIFSDTAHVKAAKSILAPAQFAEMRANYIASARESATRDGVFSSNKFKTFMDKNRFILGEALSDPNGLKQFQRLNDLNTTMRNFSDATPTNASKNIGEISKVANAIGKLAKGDIGEFLGQGKELLLGKFKAAQQRADLEAALSGKQEILRKVSAVKKMTDTTDQKIDDGIRSILLGGEQLTQKRRHQK